MFVFGRVRRIFHHRTVTPEAIKEALKQVKYPGYSRDIVSFGLVRSAALVEGIAKVSLVLTTSDPRVLAAIKTEVERVLHSLPGVKATDIDVAVGQVREPATAGGGGMIAGSAATGIKHVVAVASGKGGVGKSTFAVNLACALAQVFAAQHRPGNRVGLMDCDVYGPTVPLMIGLAGRPEIEGDGADAMLLPMEKHGVNVMSMGFLVDPEHPDHLARPDDHEDRAAIRAERAMGEPRCAVHRPAARHRRRPALHLCRPCGWTAPSW